MDLWERLIWLGVGGFIGFVLGYMVRSLHSIEEKVDHMDEVINEGKPSKRGDDGFMRHPLVADAMVLVVVFITAWAAFISQRASNQVKESQDQIKAVTVCNKVYLGAFLKAVDERTSTSSAQVDSNVKLQQSWYDFVIFQLHVPPYPEPEQRKKANVYANSLKSFLEASNNSKKKVAQNPYPTEDELDDCIKKEGKE